MTKKEKKQEKKVNYLSMFSGIGGFELGIQNSRCNKKLNCIGFMEIDKYAKNIYKKHYPNHTDYGDATKIQPEDLPEIDFLVGGFPCQAFSVAGKRRGFDDTRGTLFFEIARILKEKKPRYFLLENVKGLLSHDQGRTFQTMLGILADLGYDVQWEIYNSKDYGVPQNRQRIYIKGFLRAKCGQEILSLRKTSPKADAGQGEVGETTPLNWEWTKTRTSKIVDKNGPSLTLTSGGHNSGSNQLIIETEDKNDTNTNQLIRLDKNKNTATTRDKEEERIYSPQGVSPTLTATKCSVINIAECRGTPTLTKAMGDGGGHVPLTTVQENEEQSNVGYLPDGTRVVQVDSDRITPCTEEGNLFAVNTRPRGHPFEKHQDNYVLIKQEDTDTPNNEEKDESGPSINIVGNISPSGHHNGDVYSDKGITRTLLARDYKDPVKIATQTEPQIEKVGNVNPSGKGQSGDVFHEDGLIPTLCSTDWKCGKRVLIRNNTKKGYLEATDGDGIELAQYNARGKVQPQSTPTLNTGGTAGVLIKDNTKEGYSTAQQGDSIQLGHNNMNGPRVMKEQSPTLTQECNRIGTISDEYIIRKLTPVECERLQGFPKIEKEVEVWWSDQVKKDVLNVMEKWLKNQKSVGNAEKTKLLESVRYVEKSSHPKNQKNKKPVPKNVHINLEEKKVQLLNHEKSSSNVKIVDKKNLYLPHIKQEDFVQQVVFMNSILDQIILHGKEELLQNELYSIHQKNGKIIVNLFGGEITPPVSCVETVTTILEKLMKSTTSSHLDSEITVMTIQTWFYYVILVISGYIQKEMNINSLDYFKLSDKTGWTEYGYDGSPISDTQRYKCCGNAVTTNVVTFIMDTWDMKWD